MVKFGVQIHITEKCRYKCTHCYMEKSPVDMDMSVVESIKKQIMALREKGIHVGRISITGGDPLCHRNWESIVEELYRVGVKIKILGTPRTITKEAIETFHKYEIDTFQVSLDGLEDKHDLIRGKNSFCETIEAITKLYENGIQPHVMYTVSEFNKHDLIPLIDFLHTLNISVLFGFDFCVPIGHASQNNLSLNASSRKQIIESFCEKKKELSRQGSKLILCEKSHYINAHKYRRNDYMEQIEEDYTNIGGCSAGWNSICIMPNGDVYPCRRLPYVLGNVIHDDMYALITNHEFMKKLRDRKNYGLCSSCEKYLVCRGCPAIEYATHGGLSPLECDCYTKQINISLGSTNTIDEMEKLQKNIINASFDVDSFIADKDFLKSFYMLKNGDSMDYFVADPKCWMNRNNLKLSCAELSYLLCSYYYS